MNDIVRNDIRIAAEPASSIAGQSRQRSRALRLKRLGAGLSDAWCEILQGVKAARDAHPVISAYRPS
ncbi:Uncharacterised protein [Bordetella ansorpii]|uniref:Uncharacterized protein n=1 Tax=Bordetella ansorpii TaxID=288768 RepID=A0A157SN59_9BORD|nr:hypothetical protein [Bordetella ansorpii]SAI71877.1 Uncharacterised protein [Bordetella ansorpii]